MLRLLPVVPACFRLWRPRILSTLSSTRFSWWLNCRPSQGAWVGASLQAACRFERWVIFLELASLLQERSMLQMTLQLASWFNFVLTPCNVLCRSNKRHKERRINQSSTSYQPVTYIHNSSFNNESSNITRELMNYCSNHATADCKLRR